MSPRGTLKSKMLAEIDGGSLSLAEGSEFFLLSSMLFGLLTWYSANVRDIHQGFVYSLCLA